MKKTAIVIVVYNTAEYVVKQHETIKRFCKDDPDIIIIDNSDKPEVSEAILYRIRDLGCIYEKTNPASGNPSWGHSFAANFAYGKYRYLYSHMFFLDHDCFPIKEFSMIEILGDKVMAGMAQTRASEATSVSGKTYIWPGCLMINNEKVDPSLVDFSPNHEFNLDTGGNLYKVIEKYGLDQFVFFNEHYFENIHFKKVHYNMYAIIKDGLFMHFIGAGNWMKLPEEENIERLSGLMAILEERLKNA